MSDGETETTRERCASCLYFKPFESGQGACRRHAPTLVDVSSINPNQPELGRQVAYESAWPMMDRNEWCGDFEKKA